MVGRGVASRTRRAQEGAKDGASAAAGERSSTLRSEVVSSSGESASWPRPSLTSACAVRRAWPGGAPFYRSASGTGYALAARPVRAAVMGETLWDFYAGPTGRWDMGARLQAKVYGGQLTSSDDVTVFGGANMAAIENADGQWEVIQFATAELVNPGVYELSRFLRGQGGTETAMRSERLPSRNSLAMDEASSIRLVIVTAMPGSSSLKIFVSSVACF